MRLVSLAEGVARLEGNELVALDLDAPDLGALLARGALASCADAPIRSRQPYRLELLRAPVPRPPKVVCIGINYATHVDELRTALGDFPPPREPVFFFVPSSAVAGPADSVVLPRLAPDRVDHECELAVVVGRRAKEIAPDEAWAYVAGLTMANDISARDVQAKAMRGPALELSHAKGFDGFKPMGPVLVTLDELATAPLDLELRCRVNGEERQRARTSDLLFDIPACLSHVSQWVTLEPGDVILTGSPAGVGFFQGRFLEPGDVVEVEGEGIGTLRNEIVAARAD